MSKIKCICGNILQDSADGISYKGYILSDKEYFSLYDLADEMIESNNSNREEVAMTFRGNVGGRKSYINFREIYQCPKCGRILVEDITGEFFSFFPEKECDKKLLDYGVNGEIVYTHKKR